MPAIWKRHADGRDLIPDFPAAVRLVGVDAPRHAEEARDVLRDERQVEADHEQPEVPVAELFVEHVAERFGIPVVDPGEDGEEQARR